MNFNRFLEQKKKLKKCKNLMSDIQKLEQLVERYQNSYDFGVRTNNHQRQSEAKENIRLVNIKIDELRMKPKTIDKPKTIEKTKEQIEDEFEEELGALETKIKIMKNKINSGVRASSSNLLTSLNGMEAKYDGMLKSKQIRIQNLETIVIRKDFEAEIADLRQTKLSLEAEHAELQKDALKNDIVLEFLEQNNYRLIKT